MMIDTDEFLAFLAEALMYDAEPLAMDKPFPELVFDSTGKLMAASAIEDKYGMVLSLDDLANCVKPGDIYELIIKQN